ncbi:MULTISPECIES: response regulator [Methanoculleus]|jgi:CheY-like chemotaxis protein|uniref:Response regulator receiver domain-containing protein n=1 Tax=Methanoculleus thermophilus TaxID=2200 RepID=A0A1G8X7B6_9EURY|nr:MULTISPECIES: response regulator [Methanoculleus]NLN09146.1 response regulator [Methanoculleus thermophilus]SDJ86196.1 Response regulator receiver domain-containing protein [Methanoculleus thermophilus]HQD26003.1 response regulator [Methanoculleus thermophilus]
MIGTGGEDTRILVVEDDGIIAFDMVSRLEKLGYGVVSIAATGADAIRRAEELRPHLVFMDITLMGDMDGIEAAKIIRDRFGSRIVYVTGHSDPSIKNRAMATSPARYILKPYTTADLICAIRCALRPE